MLNKIFKVFVAIVMIIFFCVMMCLIAENSDGTTTDVCSPVYVCEKAGAWTIADEKAVCENIAAAATTTVKPRIKYMYEESKYNDRDSCILAATKPLED